MRKRPIPERIRIFPIQGLSILASKKQAQWAIEPIEPVFGNVPVVRLSPERRVSCKAASKFVSVMVMFPPILMKYVMVKPVNAAKRMEKQKTLAMEILVRTVEHVRPLFRPIFRSVSEQIFEI